LCLESRARVQLSSASIVSPYLVTLDSEAETTASAAKSLALWDTAQTHILKAALAIPLYQVRTVTVWAKAVHRVVITPNNAHALADTRVSG
jgi:hypothetical protein